MVTASVTLLAAMVIWGAVRDDELPERVPKHVGVHGVDAWTGRSVGSAFLLVFVYAGLTLLLAASAELVLRATPRDELPEGFAPFATASATVNRPRSRSSARRIARAVLLLNAAVGVTLLLGCGILWRSIRVCPGGSCP